MSGNVRKLYIANLMAGMVLWFGIEKLFMSSIGITALGVGVAVDVLQAASSALEMPSGYFADTWSRKHLLMVSAMATAIGAVVMGASQSLGPYLVGVVLYAVSLACWGGTWQALLFDGLPDDADRGDRYSQLKGRCGALYMGGYVLTGVLGGLLAHWFGFRWVYYLTVLPCLVGQLVIWRIEEPPKQPSSGDSYWQQLRQASKSIGQLPLLRTLLLVMCLLWVAEGYKEGFGQLYMARYVPSVLGVGLLWSAFYACWMLGDLAAHKLRHRLQSAIVLSVVPLVLMSVIDSWISLVLFMVQAFAAGILFNQIETDVQMATPSSVRASIFSFRTLVGRGFTVPAMLGVGWLTKHYDIVWGLRAVTVVAVLALVVWLRYKRLPVLAR